MTAVGRIVLPGNDDRREAVLVLVAAAISISAGCAVLLTVASPSSDPAVVETCHGSVTQFLPPSILTPTESVLLPRCAQFSVPSTRIEFSVQASVDLGGSWVSSYPLEVGVYNATTGPPPYGPECPGCWSTSGTLNITLFPGTYDFDMSGPGAVRASLTAVLPIVAEFDRGLAIVAPSGTVNISSGQYVARPLIVPTNVTDLWLEDSLATNGCDYALAILPPAVYEAFQLNRSAIDRPGVYLISEGSPIPCSVSTVPSPTDGGTIGPLDVSTGSTLVVFEPWIGPLVFVVQSPIEISYLSGA
jgi:hypothetical protein